MTQKNDPPPCVLIAVLDWGLGHATRSIPVIREVISQGKEPIIVSSNDALLILREAFPQIKFHELPPLNIKYSSNLPLFFALLLQLPALIKTYRAERRLLKKLIKQYNITSIIADHRYGFYHHSIPSTLIIHQVFPPLPFYLKPFRYFLYKFHLRLINRYHSCWVPDYKGPESLSGSLSENLDKYHPAVKYIGPLSRLNPELNDAKTYDIVAIVSGPEPHRSTFEQLLTNQLQHLDLHSLLITGKPAISEETSVSGQVTIINHVNADKISALINNAGVIIARSGYSTIMDLAVLNKKRLILIPTPGQPEQEYLANRLSSRGFCYSCEQHKLVVKEALRFI